MVNRVEVELSGKPLSIETGKMAKQADGSVIVRYGDTMVMVTAVAAKAPREGIDFFPLTVDYLERTYSAGKIPGGFFKREGRPTEKEVLTSRFIDRPLRPLFPEGFACETQIIATVLSSDLENNSDVLAILGASAAIEVSDIPFNGPIAGVRVARVKGKLVCNPTFAEIAESDIELIVAGSRDAVVMVEGGANFASEEDLLSAILFAHKEMQVLLDIQDELRAKVGKGKREVVLPHVDECMVQKIKEIATSRIKEAVTISKKQDRKGRISEIGKEVLETLAAEFPDREKQIKAVLGDIEYHAVRQLAVKNRVRIDGRGLKDIRPIACEVGVLPRTHGSGLFTRGETQALVVATLGTSDDEQRIDAIEGERTKAFMLHYNFPPYSTGETKPMRSPGRREVGHGALAERALAKVLPSKEEFPYTIRIVSDILESNGSSSMASVCGGSLSLMDAGVPVKDSVAGIAMGLIKEGDEFAVLSDILGDEDHLGDMDFKVTGSKNGITALQMDIKIGGVSREVLFMALEQAREGRLHILSEMAKCMTQPRTNISIYAPRIITMQVKPDKVREVIGPGGKVIKGIIEQTGVKIDIEDSGKINIASSDYKAIEKAIEIIKSITQEVEVGKIYLGTVRKIMDFGAFVEVLPGTDGLVHISQLAHERVQNVADVLKEGDKVMVKVLEVDKQGKIRLSRKDALGHSEG
ncbi:MAG: polyribonucleotide nucleotidyltransferase [Deltaproteobacteria bacterium]